MPPNILTTLGLYRNRLLNRKESPPKGLLQEIISVRDEIRTNRELQFLDSDGLVVGISMPNYSPKRAYQFQLYLKRTAGGGSRQWNVTDMGDPEFQIHQMIELVAKWLKLPKSYKVTFADNIELTVRYWTIIYWMEVDNNKRRK